MSSKARILIGVVLFLIAIQFTGNPDEVPKKVVNQDFIEIMQPPLEVSNMIKSACYDCHSYETQYPWYSGIAPLSWWINHHVDEGREHINFSIWSTYDQKKALHKLEEFYEEVEEGEMPLSSYTWMHEDAKLSPEQTQTLISWVQAIPGVEEELGK